MAQRATDHRMHGPALPLGHHRSQASAVTSKPCGPRSAQRRSARALIPCEPWTALFLNLCQAWSEQWKYS